MLINIIKKHANTNIKVAGDDQGALVFDSHKPIYFIKPENNQKFSIAPYGSRGNGKTTTTIDGVAKFIQNLRSKIY